MSNITGPKKNEAIETIRNEVRTLREYGDYSNEQLVKAMEQGADIGGLDMGLHEKLQENPGLSDKILEDDETAWEHAQDGLWACLMFGRDLPEDTPAELRRRCLHSWLNLSKVSGKVIRANDNYGTFPPTCPDKVTVVGCHFGEEEVYAAAVIDDMIQVRGNIWYHPSDPDAPLWAAIQEKYVK